MTVAGADRSRLNGGGEPRAPRYDGFISYSHAVDGKLAPVLQTEVERFARPWHRPRVRRVFRDQANLAADPSLWGAIERALAGSRWFVLLASPAAARSRWVAQEVDWWFDHHGGERLLVVLTEGRSPWDPDDAGSGDDALPPGLVERLPGEPRWVDLRWVRDAEQVDASNPRFRDCVADISAAISEVEKDSLVGEHVRQRRRTTRLIRLVITSLSVLLVAALVSGYVALDQRNVARTQAAIATRQAEVATARLLAATSQTLLPTRLDQAELLAVKAYQMDPDPETRSALFRAVTASPQLVRFAALGSAATALAAAGQAPVAVAGTSDGRVIRWDLQTGSRSDVGHLRGRVADVSVSDDGRIVAAVDAYGAVVWDATGAMERIILPAGSQGLDVAVSPSGALVAASAGSIGNDVVLSVLDRRTHLGRQVHGADIGQVLAFRDDRVLVTFVALAAWQLRDTGTLAVEQSGAVNFGVHNLANALSRNGRYVGYSNGDRSIPVWDTSSPAPDPDKPNVQGSEPGRSPEALAISADGRRTAVADTGSVFVSDTRADGIPDTVVRLDGNTRINPNGVVFGSDSDQLLTMSQDRLALWDLRRTGRIVRSFPATIPVGCSACPPPRVATGPTGATIAVVAGDSETASVLDTSAAAPVEKVIRNSIDQTELGPPAWDASGRYLFLATDGGKGRTYSAAGNPVGDPWPVAPQQGSLAAVAARHPDGLVLLDASGAVTMRSAAGRVTASFPPPAHMAAVQAFPLHAAVSVSGIGVIFDPEQGAALVVDPRRGQVRKLPGDVATDRFGSVLMRGGHLLVNRPDGSVELWTEDGSTRERRITGEESVVEVVAASPAGDLLAQRRTDGTIVVRDLNSGVVIGSLQSASPRLSSYKTGIAFSPDGAELISATEQPDDPTQGAGEVRVWNLRESAWVDAACRAAGRSLTLQEWQQYAGPLPPGDLGCGQGASAVAGVPTTHTPAAAAASATAGLRAPRRGRRPRGG